MGTGSGILAIAAARLGASRVWARDVDPIAVGVARENVRVNDVVRTIHLVRGRGLGPTPLRAGVIVANLIAETVAALLPAVRSRLECGGMFVGSGIVADRLPEVLAAQPAELEQHAFLFLGQVTGHDHLEMHDEIAPAIA